MTVMPDSIRHPSRRAETEIHIETQSVPRAHLAARLCTGWLRRAAQP